MFGEMITEAAASQCCTSPKNLIVLLEFLVPFTIIDFDQSAAAAYGSI